MSEPRITLQAAHVSAGSNLPVHRVVIHGTNPGTGYPKASANGQAKATAGYFQSPSSGGSAQYIRDAVDEEHCVRDNAIAWHAPPNPGSIGIEICSDSDYTEEQWKSPKVKAILREAAKRTAELCIRFDLPVQRLHAHDLLEGKRGICGHVDVSEAWHQTDHTDPGPHFPWIVFMNMVEEEYRAMKGKRKHKRHDPSFPGRTLHLGVHGDDVYQFQMQMRHRGWSALGKVDNQFGPKCVQVTKAFQKEKRLKVTGRVDKATWDRAFKAPVT